MPLSDNEYSSRGCNLNFQEAVVQFHICEVLARSSNSCCHIACRKTEGQGDNNYNPASILICLERRIQSKLGKQVALLLHFHWRD